MGYSVLLDGDLKDKRVDADWGSLTWLASKEIGNAEGLSVGKVVIKPGRSNPRHSHPNCEEVLYLMSGRLEHFVGEERITASAGDVLTVSPGVSHHATNIGDEDAHMIVAYSQGVRDFRLEK